MLLEPTSSKEKQAKDRKSGFASSLYNNGEHRDDFVIPTMFRKVLGTKDNIVETTKQSTLKHMTNAPHLLMKRPGWGINTSFIKRNGEATTSKDKI